MDSRKFCTPWTASLPLRLCYLHLLVALYYLRGDCGVVDPHHYRVCKWYDVWFFSRAAQGVDTVPVNGWRMRGLK